MVVGNDYLHAQLFGQQNLFVVSNAQVHRDQQAVGLPPASAPPSLFRPYPSARRGVWGAAAMPYRRSACVISEAAQMPSTS